MKGINPVFGKSVRARRQGLGLTQKQTARKVGVSAQYLCDVESARRYPAPGMAHRIASAIDAKLILLGYRCPTCGGDV